LLRINAKEIEEIQRCSLVRTLWAFEEMLSPLLTPPTTTTKGRTKPAEERERQNDNRYEVDSKQQFDFSRSTATLKCLKCLGRVCCGCIDCSPAASRFVYSPAPGGNHPHHGRMLRQWLVKGPGIGRGVPAGGSVPDTAAHAGNVWNRSIPWNLGPTNH